LYKEKGQAGKKSRREEKEEERRDLSLAR